MFCLVSERPHSLRDLALGGRGWEIPFFLHTSRAQMQQVILQNLVPVHSGFATATSMSPRPVQSPAQLGTGGAARARGVQGGRWLQWDIGPRGSRGSRCRNSVPLWAPTHGWGQGGAGLRQDLDPEREQDWRQAERRAWRWGLAGMGVFAGCWSVLGLCRPLGGFGWGSSS